MRKLLLLLVPLALIGCQDAPTGPSVQSPQYDWMNNPDNGNLRVFRVDAHTIVCWTDAGTQLRACHATLPLGGANPDPDCGLQDVIDPTSRQEIGEFDPSDVPGSWLHVNQKGDVWITVRDLTIPGDCFGNRLVAEGMGTLHYSDNDLFGSAPGDHNANTWGFTAQGRLTRPEGGTVVYQGRNQFRYNDQQLLHVISSTAVVH